MGCEKIQAIIPHYVNHAASNEETQAIEEHLCVCHQCRQYLSQIIDGNKKTFAKDKAEARVTTQFDLWSYLVLIVGLAILSFLTFLYFKSR